MPQLRRHSHVFDLLDALAQPGCPVCALVRRSGWRYLDALAYENVNDPGIRARLRAALGFCNRHAWAFLEEHRESLGTAIIARDIIRTLVLETGQSLTALVPRGPCPACEAEQTTAAHVLETLAELLGDDDVVDAYRRSDGLCAPHLLQGMSVRRESDRRRLLAMVTEGWVQTAGQLAGVRLVCRAVGEAGVFGKDVATLDAPTGEDGPDRGPEPPIPRGSTESCVVCQAIRGHHDDAVPGNVADAIASLCARHAWDPWGQQQTALLRRQIEAARILAQALVSEHRSPLALPLKALGLWNPMRDSRRLACVACARQRRIEMRAAHIAESALCLPHLRHAVAWNNQAAWLATRQRWLQFDWLLSEYIRKHDYRFRDEPRGEEQQAPRLATLALVGERGVR